MADVNGAHLKTESDSTPQIKIEQDAAAPSPYMDEDDIYEDAGDLDFAQAGQPLWLTRLPTALYNAWADVADDEEIEIGTVRVEGPVSDPTRVSLLLKDIPQFRTEPKEYNLRLPSRDPSSRLRSSTTYVFSEKDMPGFVRRQYGLGPDGSTDGDARGRSFLYEKNRREAKKRENRKRWEPYVRRPIPKQTALTGTVARDFVADPVKNELWRMLEDQKTREALKPKRIDEREGFTELKSVTYLAPGTVSRADTSLQAKKQQALKNAAAKDNRAARMPQNELIDGLVALFRNFRWWGLRDIKARIPQPEAYLRETLQLIAFMHKSGDAVGRWELNANMKPTGAASDNVKDEVAPKVEGEVSDIGTPSGVGTPAGGDDEDEDDVMFENVT